MVSGSDIFLPFSIESKYDFSDATDQPTERIDFSPGSLFSRLAGVSKTRTASSVAAPGSPSVIPGFSRGKTPETVST